MKKFYVLYCAKDLTKPQIYKTLQRVKIRMQSNPNLKYEEYSSELQAQKFSYLKKMNYFQLEEQSAKDKVDSGQAARSKPQKRAPSSSKPKIANKHDVEELQDKDVSEKPTQPTNLEFVKSQLSTQFASEKYGKIILPNDKNQPQTTFKTFPKQAANLNQNQRRGISSEQQSYLNIAGTAEKPVQNQIDAENIRRTYEEVLNLMDSDKFIKSNPKIGIKSNVKYFAFFDGCSKFNPGPSGAGYVVLNESNKVVFERSVNLGTKTNNQAQYFSLLLCLLDCKFNKIHKLRIFGDSQIAVKGMIGQYQIQQKKIKYLNMLCQQISQSFSEFQINHILRQNNKYADKLSNKALKQKYLGKSSFRYV